MHSLGTGGLEKGIATIVNHHSKEFRHTIISLSGAGESARLISGSTKTIFMNKKEGNSLLFILKLANILKKESPDIVHTRNWSGMDGIVAARIAGIKGIIHGEHGWDMLDPYGTSLKRQYIRRFLSRFVNEYTCVSIQLADWLHEHVKIKKKINQIYNGIDNRQFKPVDLSMRAELREKIGLSKDGFVIGTAGRLDTIKNHLLLINAFGVFKTKMGNSYLVIAGDGPERGRLEKKGNENILLLGNRSDIDLIIKCLDVFVLPSWNEGISNTILESMSCGVPVIASDVGGNPELIDHGMNGFLFNPSVQSELAGLLVTYAQNPGLAAQHGRTGRQKAVSDFSVDLMVKGYEAVYKRVSKECST